MRNSVEFRAPRFRSFSRVGAVDAGRKRYAACLLCPRPSSAPDRAFELDLSRLRSSRRAACTNKAIYQLLFALRAQSEGTGGRNPKVAASGASGSVWLSAARPNDVSLVLGRPQRPSASMPRARRAWSRTSCTPCATRCTRNSWPSSMRLTIGHLTMSSQCAASPVERANHPGVPAPGHADRNPPRTARRR